MQVKVPKYKVNTKKRERRFNIHNDFKSIVCQCSDFIAFFPPFKFMFDLLVNGPIQTYLHNGYVVRTIEFIILCE